MEDNWQVYKLWNLNNHLKIKGEFEFFESNLI